MQGGREWKEILTDKTCAGNTSHSELKNLKHGMVGSSKKKKKKKLNLELPYDPAILLLDIYPKELQAGTETDICTPLFIAALSAIAKR